MVEADQDRESANILAFREVYAEKYNEVYTGPRIG